MSSTQQLTLLSGVSVIGPGSAMSWNGGRAFVAAWWDAASGTVLALQVSFDGGTHWGSVSAASRSAPGNPAFSLTTSGGQQMCMSPLNLPPCLVRGAVFGSAPTNLTMIMQGYNEALEMPNAD